MRMADVLRGKPHKLITVAADATVGQAIALMKGERIGATLVLDGNGGLRGLLTERDVVYGLVERGPQVLALPVAALMAWDVPTASPDEPLHRVMRLMTERRARYVPVVAEDRVVGLVSIGDAIKARLGEKIEENQVLQDLAGIRIAIA